MLSDEVWGYGYYLSDVGVLWSSVKVLSGQVWGGTLVLCEGTIWSGVGGTLVMCEGTVWTGVKVPSIAMPELCTHLRKEGVL